MIRICPRLDAEMVRLDCLRGQLMQAREHIRWVVCSRLMPYNKVSMLPRLTSAGAYMDFRVPGLQEIEYARSQTRY